MDLIDEDIRRLDDQLRDAMLRSDLAALDRLCSEQFVVTNPFNQVLSKQQVIEAVRSGTIKHTSFERQIEYLGVHGPTAVVMGLETLADAGPAYQRRYTEVWAREDASWQLVARHANKISQ